MEEFLQGLGIFGVAILAIIGAVAGAIAGAVTGRNMALFVVGGIVGALALPFVLALLGFGLVIGAGLLGILAVGVVGAVLILVIVQAVRR